MSNPSSSIPSDVLRNAVAAAVQAPSIHNTQPWRFRLGYDQIDLYADRQRMLAVVDASGRQLVLSCGAALLFLRVALRAQGFDAEVRSVPSSEDDHLATVRISSGDPATEDELALAAAIGERHMQRTPFEARALPAAELTALRRAAEAEGGWLHALRRREDQLALTSLLAHADAAESADDSYRAEVRAWVRTDASTDGIPAEVLPAAGERHSELVLRDFAPDQLATDAADPERPPVDEHPVVVVLGTDSDDVQDALTAGQALGHLLLRATASGIGASPLGQVLDWPGPRAQLRRQLGLLGQPQMVLRLGYAAPAPAASTARRPLEEVLLP